MTATKTTGSLGTSKKDPSGQAWWVYLLRCGDGTLYCGIALDPGARLKQHEDGKGARYTRGRGPLELVYREACATKGQALRREREIKRFDRAKKAALFSG